MLLFGVMLYVAQCHAASDEPVPPLGPSVTGDVRGVERRHPENRFMIGEKVTVHGLGGFFNWKQKRLNGKMMVIAKPSPKEGTWIVEDSNGTEYTLHERNLKHREFDFLVGETVKIYNYNFNKKDITNAKPVKILRPSEGKDKHWIVTDPIATGKMEISEEFLIHYQAFFPGASVKLIGLPKTVNSLGYQKKHDQLNGLTGTLLYQKGRKKATEFPLNRWRPWRVKVTSGDLIGKELTTFENNLVHLHNRADPTPTEIQAEIGRAHV